LRVPLTFFVNPARLNNTARQWPGYLPASVTSDDICSRPWLQHMQSVNYGPHHCPLTVPSPASWWSNCMLAAAGKGDRLGL